MMGGYGCNVISVDWLLILLLSVFILICIYQHFALRGVRRERDSFAQMSRDDSRADFLANIGEG